MARNFEPGRLFTIPNFSGVFTLVDHFLNRQNIVCSLGPTISILTRLQTRHALLVLVNRFSLEPFANLQGSRELNVQDDVLIVGGCIE